MEEAAKHNVHTVEGHAAMKKDGGVLMFCYGRFLGYVTKWKKPTAEQWIWLLPLVQGSANICLKSQIGNIFGCSVSVTTIQLCLKATIDNTSMNEHECLPGKLSLQKQAMGQIWPAP